MSEEEQQTENKVSSIWDRKRVISDYSLEPSLTKSEFKDECDINNVVARALRTGVLPGIDRQALYGDFSQVTDYATAQVKIAEAKQSFEQLPSDIKEQFDNDVTKLLDWIDNPDNEEEAIKLGLLPGEVSSEANENTTVDDTVLESNQVEDSSTVDS